MSWEEENHARVRIRFYWIVNLVDQQIEVTSEPADDGFGFVQTYTPGEEVPVVIDGTEVGRIAVSAIQSRSAVAQVCYSGFLGPIDSPNTSHDF